MPVTTATVLPTTLDQVLIGVRARLVAVLRFPEERVLVLDPEEVSLPPPQGDSLVYFWPDTEMPDNPIFQGAGRLDARDTVRLLVEVATRSAVDAKQDSSRWLIDPQSGHLRTRHAVLNALLGFVVTDAGKNWLTAPFQPAPLGRPRREGKGQKPTPGWGRSRLAFYVTYVLALDPTF